MKKNVFLLVLLIAFFQTYSQTSGDVRYNRGIFNTGIYLRNYWIDTIRNDTDFRGALKSLPTADAVARFVDGKLSGVTSSGLKTVADTTARNAIATEDRYEGMLVYVADVQKYYSLKGGITNSFWVELAQGETTIISTGSGVFIDNF